MQKSWWTSKTVIVNGLTSVLAVAAALQGQEFIASNPRLSAGIVAVVGVVNVALRFITYLPIGG